MRKTGAVAGLIAAIILLVPPAAAAANKEHQQLMAEIRMLQEQQQQLQQLIYGLAATLEAVTARLEDQSGTTRKSFADQKLLIDGVAETARILREKSDDTNVRLSSMTQEIQALRQTVASLPPPAPLTPTVEGLPGIDPGAVPPPAPAPAVPPPANVSPTAMWDRIFADYTAGQYDLAISGFESFIRTFPTSPSADDAQLYIGNSHYNAGSYKDALAAYQKVILDYTKSDSVAVAWYKLGQTHERLNQPNEARKAYETVIKEYPSSNEAQLARTRLDSLRRE
ncbi:MAG TPA: tol-pal system protein YbgF [Vicinamibacterales bacterium]|nr:tol-pal system protein YbgF [Vicinamibacterales bacterium]